MALVAQLHATKAELQQAEVQLRRLEGDSTERPDAHANVDTTTAVGTLLTALHNTTVEVVEMRKQIRELKAVQNAPDIGSSSPVSSSGQRSSRLQAAKQARVQQQARKQARVQQAKVRAQT